ncbi:unnamed protein product [Parnassius apollo]|uniref:(apollo) hypothetical protein n=1 Tax=Parnassius apollo TaxID=110799 RepID=A0A8S3WTW3_PARAO|nr:unnamed protein product [Parnassius apollo]
MLKKNKEVSEKSEPSEVSCECQFTCTCLTLECRKKLFHDFWNLGDYNEQQIYLKNLIRLCLINRRRHGNYEDATESRRQQACRKFRCVKRRFAILLVLVNAVCEIFFSNDVSVKDRRKKAKTRASVERKDYGVHNVNTGSRKSL